MKEKPILFNSEMVKGVWEDRKTHTRRLRGLEELNKNPNAYHLFSETPDIEGKFLFCAQRGQGDIYVKCPYGKPGHRLWVRETWAAPKPYDDTKPSLLELENDDYRRITLEITDIGVERVKDINEKDSKKEGVISNTERFNLKPSPNDTMSPSCVNGYKWQFMHLWNSINEKRGYSWEINPWVWVIEFKKLKDN